MIPATLSTYPSPELVASPEAVLVMRFDVRGAPVVPGYDKIRIRTLESSSAARVLLIETTHDTRGCVMSVAVVGATSPWLADILDPTRIGPELAPFAEALGRGATLVRLSPLRETPTEPAGVLIRAAALSTRRPAAPSSREEPR